MYRYLSIGFGLSLIIVSIMAVAAPEGNLSILLSTSAAAHVVRVFFGLGIIMYSLMPWLRYDLFRDVLIATGVLGTGYIMYGLLTDLYIFPKPVDLFFVVQSAVVSFVATLDFVRPKAVQKFLPNITAPELFIAKVRTLRVSPPLVLRVLRRA